ncbi:MAG: hypothetical protein KC478_04200 [Bacteriovoracaceae bacterium]|nr:hypothetical protein [Bacteriovoracaceae bacterium]
MSNFETSVTRGELFGLMQRTLTIKKEVCQLSILNKKSFFETDYKIDVCREPIHMKVTVRGTLDVYKRDRSCDSRTQSEFCDFWSKLKSDLQDQGLIFATGEREKLSTAHGKVYCSYLLLNKYLGKGVLFSKYNDPSDIYEDNEIQKRSNPKKVKLRKESPKKEKAPSEELGMPQGRF